MTLANVNLLGYKGLANIVETTTTGYELELLEGTLKGKRVYVSKNSTTETIEVIKATAKLTKTGRMIDENGHYEGNYVYYNVEVTANSLKNAEMVHELLISKMVKELSYLEASEVGCSWDCETESNKMTYGDSLSITFENGRMTEIDKDVKQAWKEVKRELGI